MKLIDVTTAIGGQRVAVPVDKIIGIQELKKGNTYISTGPDGVDGEENGWYVADKYIDVRMMLEGM